VTFPEHVKAVASVGVTRYQVDLINHQATYHLIDGTTHTESLPRLQNNCKPSFFSEANVKAAVTAIQKKMIDYPTFLNQIASSGTKGYEVDLTEKEVTYFGEEEQNKYIEKFPGLSKN
jgi:uncharacterized protein YbcV (DUF1398 family)